MVNHASATQSSRAGWRYREGNSSFSGPTPQSRGLCAAFFCDQAWSNWDSVTSATQFYCPKLLLLIIFWIPLGVYFVWLLPKMFFLKFRSFSTIFHVVTVTFCRKTFVLLSPQFRKVRRQKPQSFLFFFFLPHNYLTFTVAIVKIPSSSVDFIKNIYTESAKNTAISRRTMIFLIAWVKSCVRIYMYAHIFIGMHIEQVCDIDFPSLEAKMVQTVRSYWIAIHWPPFCFCHGSKGPRPAIGRHKLIFSYEVNFFHRFPLSWLRQQKGSFTAEPCQEAWD